MNDQTATTDNNPAGAAAQNGNQPVFMIEKLYVKDLSLEAPNTPQVFLEQQQPQVNVQIAPPNAAQVGDGFYEVSLSINVSSKLPDDRTVFMVECVQAGVFQIRNVPEKELDPLLRIGCANIIYPYAREVVSDAILRAGFPPVLLAPVNFEQVYAAYREQLAKQQQQQPANG